MNIINTLLFLLAATILFNSCCTKAECLVAMPYPPITLHFPDASFSEQNLTYTRLNPATNQAVDSVTVRTEGRTWVFIPWQEFGDQNWGNYNYVFTLEEPTFRDTIYNITYNRVVNRIDCNECFPPSDRGKVEVVSYENLQFYHQGRELYYGDTVLMRKR